MLCFGKFPVANKFVDEKDGEGGSIKIFCRKLFVPQSQKKFVGEASRVSLISGIEKIYA